MRVSLSRFYIIITAYNDSFNCSHYERGRSESQYHKSEPAAHGFLFMHRIQWRAALRQQKNNAHCALYVCIPAYALYPELNSIRARIQPRSVSLGQTIVAECK